jgi:hypothetical protein
MPSVPHIFAFQILIYRGEVTNKKWSLLKKLRKTYNQLRSKNSRKLKDADTAGVILERSEGSRHPS